MLQEDVLGHESRVKGILRQRGHTVQGSSSMLPSWAIDSVVNNNFNKDVFWEGSKVEGILRQRGRIAQGCPFLRPYCPAVS